MGTKRPFTKYVVKKAGKILNGGITTDFELCKLDYEGKHPGTKLERVGGACSEQTARNWVKDMGYN